MAEIAQEKALALGRAGRRLEVALAALRELDARGGGDAVERRARLDEAGEALFFYVVQREACGLRDTAEILESFDVPREVQFRMGLKGVRR